MSPYFASLWKILGMSDSLPVFWNIYVLCNNNTLESAEIFKKLKGMCVEDQKSARSRLVDLDEKSKMDIMVNQSFHTIYDEKDFHESFSCDVKTNKGATITVKVLRLRKSDVRIFLFYPKGMAKTAIILSALAKRKDKLSKGEEDYLKELVESTVPYWDSTNPLHTDFSGRVI